MFSNDYVFTDNDKINSAINFYLKNKNTDFPIIISGKNGSGKTHILKSLQNYYQSKKVSNIVYISAELFKNEFIESIKKGEGENPEFFVDAVKTCNAFIKSLEENKEIFI